MRWRLLAPEHRRFLVVDEMIGGAIVSFFVNLALGWCFFFWKPVVPVVGWPSVLQDFIGMAIMLPGFTALGATIVVDRAVASGKLPPLAGRGDTRWLCTAGWIRGTWAGVVTAAVLVPPVVLGLRAAGHHALSFAHFLWLKGIVAAVIGALATPPIGWWALEDASRLVTRQHPAIPAGTRPWIAKLRTMVDPFNRFGAWTPPWSGRNDRNR